MNVNFKIIAILSNEDKKRFLLFLKEKNKRQDVKNIDLFKLLDTSREPENIDVLLYGKAAKGAYHALSKRLHDALIDFLATKSFENESSVEMKTLKLLLASRIFFKHQEIEIGFKTLVKAEAKAKKYLLYTVLSEIYLTKLEYTHLSKTIKLSTVIDAYKKNKLDIVSNENLGLFYATIHKELLENEVSFSEIIDKNLLLFDISITENLTYESLYKILELTNQVGNITRDYYAILPFIENAYQQIKVSERIKDKHLFYHIQILYFMANAYFRIKNFIVAMNYLELMHSYMELESKKEYILFYPKYLLLQSLINVYTGNTKKAILEISETNYREFEKQLSTTLDLKLTLVVALFLDEKFSEAFKIYKEFNRSDTWYINKSGMIWVIKKNLIEILLLIELNHLDLLESRLKSFHKKHKNHLIASNENRIVAFLKLIEIFYYKKEDVYAVNFKQKVQSLLKTDKKEEDIFVLSFYSWIQAKIMKTKLYPTCLELIGNKI